MAKPFLIVCDLDGTLLGDSAAVTGFSEWLKPRRKQVRLVYSSGRSPTSQRGSVAEHRLPEPDALIGEVGTRVEQFAQAEPIAGWPQLSGPWDPTLVRQALAEVNRLELQPAEFLSPYKISYYYHDATAADLAEVRALLDAAKVDARVVYSSQRDLDVLPAGIDKGAAAAHLARRWRLPADRVIVCGDTANDLAMFEQGFLGVVVGNALPELKSLESPRVYHAQGHFAAGVREGLEHWLERATAGV